MRNYSSGSVMKDRKASLKGSRIKNERKKNKRKKFPTAHRRNGVVSRLKMCKIIIGKTVRPVSEDISEAESCENVLLR